jgi:formamidopyrimidine-DNA glycosylase
MPELPEVETIARQLAPRVRGRRVRALELRDPLLSPAPPASLLRGRRVERVFRLGKQLLLELGRRRGRAVWLAYHLRMTGRLLWAPDARTAAEPRARLRLEGGDLLFCDVRRFGTLRLVRDLEQAAPAGLDPTGEAFTVGALRRLLAGSRQPLKPWLLRQDRLVGLGNIYAAEILFEARLDPRRQAGALSAREAARLHRATGEILGRAIANCGTTFNDFQDARGLTGSYQRYLQVYGRQGEPCPRCGATLRRITQQQRSTFYCGRCQRRR